MLFRSVRIIRRLTFVCIICWLLVSDDAHKQFITTAEKTLPVRDPSTINKFVEGQETKADTVLPDKPLPEVTAAPTMRFAEPAIVSTNQKPQAVPQLVSTQHQVENLFDQGYTVKDVAKELGLDKRKVRAIKKQFRRENRSLKRKRKKESKKNE